LRCFGLPLPSLSFVAAAGFNESCGGACGFGWRCGGRPTAKKLLPSGRIRSPHRNAAASLAWRWCWRLEETEAKMKAREAVAAHWRGRQRYCRGGGSARTPSCSWGRARAPRNVAHTTSFSGGVSLAWAWSGWANSRDRAARKSTTSRGASAQSWGRGMGDPSPMAAQCHQQSAAALALLVEE
jgi:hypothetical protein